MNLYSWKHDEPGGPSCVVVCVTQPRIVAYTDTVEDAELVTEALNRTAGRTE